MGTENKYELYQYRARTLVQNLFSHSAFRRMATVGRMGHMGLSHCLLVSE